MRDLTRDSVVSHMLIMATPVVISAVAQIIYQLVDLYFVARISVEAAAGVNAAGNALFVVTAVTQVLSVGTVSLVAQALGREDPAYANVVLNQCIALSLACAITSVALLSASIRPYLRSVGANEATIDAGVAFVLWVLPGYALLLPMTVLTSALRGSGIVQPTIALHVLIVVINAILAPVLIAGWGTGLALGVTGAGLATTLSIAVGLFVLGMFFNRLQPHMCIDWKSMRLRFALWRSVLAVGLPAGADFVLFFLYGAVVYYVTRTFGAAAQAGFGIGSRVLQTILLPGLAIALSIAPIVGQNYGAKKMKRVREVFRKAVIIGTGFMLVAVTFVQRRPESLLSVFDTDISAIEVAKAFLQLMSWTFVAQGLVYTCSGMFQGFGNTVPQLISTTMSLVAFAIAAIWLSTQPSFYLEQLWYVAIAAVALQATISLWLLRREFKSRLVLDP